jgi:hypothetical protein
MIASLGGIDSFAFNLLTYKVMPIMMKRRICWKKIWDGIRPRQRKIRSGV